MNSLYIGVGVAIILALVTALVGPYFIDWTTYRAAFEREGQRIFGENVTLLGQVKVRLLPTPTLILDDVVIGPVYTPDVTIKRVDLKVEVTPLLKGEIRIADLRLDRPVARVGIDADGKLAVPGRFALLGKAGSGSDVGSVGLESAEIVDGSLVLVDQRNGTEASVDGLNGTASAAALTGPAMLDGTARYDGQPVSFHFATGKRGVDGIWPMRLQTTLQQAPYQLNIETALDIGTGKATGTVALERLGSGAVKGDKAGQPPTPWHLTSDFAADSQVVTFDKLQLSIGAAASAVTLAGKAQLDIGHTSTVAIDLAANQIDIDRMLADSIDVPADVQMTVAKAEGLLLGLPRWPIAGRVHLALAGAVIGSGAVQDVDLDVRTRADGWAIDSFSARLPGRATVTANGRLVVTSPLRSTIAADSGVEPAAAPGPRFEGLVSLVADQPATLLQWWRKGDVPALDPVRFSGRVAVSSGGFAVDELTASIGSSAASGAIDWVDATPQHGEQFKAVLSADQIDLDQVKIIAGLIAVKSLSDGGRGPDLPGEVDLDLDAETMIVGGERLKGVAARTLFDGQSLVIDRLAVRDAAGAAIDVKGRVDKLTTTPDGSIEGSIHADRLTGLAHLIGTFFPGQPWVQRLRMAVPGLAPLVARGHMTGIAGEADTDLQLSLDGTAAGSRLALAANFTGRLDEMRQGMLDASVQLSGPDGGLVLRQIGIPVSSDQISAGKVLISAKGVPARGLAVTANADIGGSRALIHGQARLNEQDSFGYDGEAMLSSTDLRQLATIFGLALPSGGATVPFEANARIAGEGLKVGISSLSGHVSEAGMRAGGHIDFAQVPVRIDGDLHVSDMDLKTLLELGLGADALQAAASPGAVWPSDVLSGPVFQAIDAAIALDADRLQVDETHSLDRFTAKLRLHPDRLLLDDVDAGLSDGRLTGALALTRAADGAMGVSGILQLNAVRLAGIVWRTENRPIAEGALDLSSTFQSNGRSISALAAAFTGAGTLSVTDGMVRYLDPDAFARTIAAADAGPAAKDEKIRSIFLAGLDAGSLALPRLDATFAIDAGVLNVNAVTAVVSHARLSGSAALDFGRWTLTADGTLKADQGQTDKIDGDPSVGIAIAGPIDHPKRTVDIAPLTAFLTLRSVEREARRVEDLQADSLERDRFQRELKRLKDARMERDQAEKAAASPEAAHPPAAAPATAKPAKSGTTKLPSLPSLPPAVVIPPPPPVRPLLDQTAPANP